MKHLISLGLALMIFSSIQAQRFEVDTISMSGPIDERINFVFLSDGYQESELDKFIEDAHWMKDALLSKEPYLSYRDYFNCFAIKVPSNVSGAANDPDSLIDNYFGSSFNSFGIWRLVTPRRSSKIQPVLRDNFPQYDQVVIIVNDDRYGGSGGWAATSTTHTNGPEICIHEIGHSFGGVSDEYWAGQQYARENINMTQETSRTLVRWKNWLDYRSVGIYSHDESPTWKRPHQNCEMRYLNSQFCPVCQEAIANKILNLTNPIIEYSPAEDGFILDEPEIEFSVNLLKPNPNTMHLVWTLNGEPRANNVENLRFESSAFAAGENTVSVYILDTTKFIRSSDHNTKHLHQIHWTFNSGTSGIHLDEVQTNKFNIDIYPNPAHSFIKISGELQNPAKVGMDLLTIDGRQIRFIEVRERPAGAFAEEFDIQKLSLSSGLYHVLISVDGQIVSIPLVIN